MDNIENLLEQFKAGKISREETVRRLSTIQEKDLGHTVVDVDRRRRTGDAEVIYCAGKTAGQVTDIVSSFIEAGERVLATRVSEETAQAVLRLFPKATYHETARIVTVGEAGEPKQTTDFDAADIDSVSAESGGPASTRVFASVTGRPIAVVAAGTSDLPVFEEAAVTAEFFGHEVIRAVDVGVAGLHRLLRRIDEIRRARVIVAVAGMEGALPSVVAGLVDVPVVAVPTSVGYGANFGGLTALLAMVNSCASGVSVVNIDNGFGGAYMAHLISR